MLSPMGAHTTNPKGTDSRQKQPARPSSARPLTARAEEFCRLLVADPTLPVGTAYERAGYKSTGLQAQKNAAELRKKPEIARRIAAARADLNVAAGKSRERWLAERDEDRRLAISLGQMGAAVAAGVAEGKARGYLDERVTLRGDAEHPLFVLGALAQPGVKALAANIAAQLAADAALDTDSPTQHNYALADAGLGAVCQALPAPDMPAIGTGIPQGDAGASLAAQVPGERLAPVTGP